MKWVELARSNSIVYAGAYNTTPSSLIIIRENPGRVITTDVMLALAWPQSLTPVNIMSGFRKCGHLTVVRSMTESLPHQSPLVKMTRIHIYQQKTLGGMRTFLRNGIKRGTTSMMRRTCPG